MSKPLIFLSSGQSASDANGSCSERDTVIEVRKDLEKLGFDVWVAFTKHDTKSLREIIFPKLRDADYFVFIDFKREKVVSPNGSRKSQQKHRGSLFSHQEFGIAAFLDLPIACFHEEGVEELNGIRGVVAANSRPFSDRSQLPATVAQEIRNRIEEGDWSLTSSNQLNLSLAQDSGIPSTWPGGRKVKYYHINVTNKHHRKVATGCCAYLSSARHVDSDEKISVSTAEFKWEGIESSIARINPQRFRGFDAILVEVGNPNKLMVMPFTDASNFIINISDNAKLEFVFTVCSDQFPDAHLRIVAEFHSDSGKLLLTPSAEGGVTI